MRGGQKVNSVLITKNDATNEIEDIIPEAMAYSAFKTKHISIFKANFHSYESVAKINISKRFPRNRVGASTFIFYEEAAALHYYMPSRCHILQKVKGNENKFYYSNSSCSREKYVDECVITN